jgi:hypothetical protein
MQRRLASTTDVWKRAISALTCLHPLLCWFHPVFSERRPSRHRKHRSRCRVSREHSPTNEGAACLPASRSFDVSPSYENVSSIELRPSHRKEATKVDRPQAGEKIHVSRTPMHRMNGTRLCVPSIGRSTTHHRRMLRMPPHATTRFRTFSFP